MSEDLRQPYPGLRPFDACEADVFFGREAHVDALLERLSASHFVAVVGESGAGKSSLVRAGLLPALEAGFVVEAGSDWRTAILRPGGTPLIALADALLAPGVLSLDGGVPHREFALAELRRGPAGIVRLVRDSHLGETCNTLIVVDQFEELFRYCREPSQKDQANIFVELLLHAARQRHVPVFVVLTMRSDFVGECARFSGLPEVLNDNQYLTPRLTRDQIAAAIREPARVCRGVVDRDLVDQLCNAVGDDQDQLPLLQHLLMRLWDEAAKETKPSPGADGRRIAWPRLTFAPSANVGDLHSALSNHAQQIYDSLPPGKQVIARTLFKCLTDPQSQRRDVRRDALVSEVAAVAEVSVTETIEVADEFRADGRHMLMPPQSVALDADARLDISHESLIRQWSQLGRWACEEGTNAREFVRLRDEAARERDQQGELLSGRALARAQDWLKHAAPTSAWAHRYADPGDLEATLAFIHKSEEEAQRRKDEAQRAAARVANLRNRLMASCMILLVLGGSIVFTMWREAEQQRGIAEEQQVIAEEQRVRAEKQRAAADEQSKRADAAALTATRNSDRANELLLKSELQNQIIGQQNTEVSNQRTKAHASLLLADAMRALPRDPALATLFARAAVTEQEASVLALRALREALTAHVPSVRPDFTAARFRNYVPGKNRGKWLDFSLSSASFSPIDDTVVTPSGPDAVIWSTTSGARIQTLRAHSGIVGSAIFSPDGHSVVTTGSDRTARIWDVATGAMRQTLQHGDLVNAAVFNHQGTLLATLADDANAKVWKVEKSLNRWCDIKLASYANFAWGSFSHDNSYLATVTYANRRWEAQVWNVALDGCPKVETPLDTAPNLKWVGFSPLGPSLAAVNLEGEVVVYTVPDWKEQRRFKPQVRYLLSRADNVFLAHQNVPPALAWSPDGRHFAAAGGDNSVSIVPLSETDSPIELRGHSERITSISFACNGAALLTTSSDGSASVWALAPDKQLVERLNLIGHDETVASGAFSPKGDRVVTAANDGTVRSWMPMYSLRELRRAGVGSVMYSKDGTRIRVAGLNSSSAGFWLSEVSATSLSPVTEPLTLQTRGPLTFLGTKIFERNQTDVTLRDLWEPAASSVLPETAQLGVNAAVRVSPDSRFAFSQTKSTDATVWDLSRPQVEPLIVPLPSIREYGACKPLAVSNAGELAMYCPEKDLVLVTRQGRLEHTRILVHDETKVVSARFANSGGLLAFALEDDSARVFDIQSGRTLAIMKGHAGPIRSLDFTRDDRFLVSAGSDSTARVWESSTGTPIASFTATHLPPFTQASFSPDGLSVLLLAADRLLVWRCYGCGDTKALFDEVAHRKIDRPLSHTEQVEYGLASKDLTVKSSNGLGFSQQSLQALK